MGRHTIEIALGANAGSKAEQDFSHLGIGAKTFQSMPPETAETTFVSLRPWFKITRVLRGKNSHVKHKLSKVLWIPGLRRTLTSLVYQHRRTDFVANSNAHQAQQLRQD